MKTAFDTSWRQQFGEANETKKKKTVSQLGGMFIKKKNQRKKRHIQSGGSGYASAGTARNTQGLYSKRERKKKWNIHRNHRSRYSSVRAANFSISILMPGTVNRVFMCGWTCVKARVWRFLKYLLQFIWAERHLNAVYTIALLWLLWKCVYCGRLCLGRCVNASAQKKWVSRANENTASNEWTQQQQKLFL